MSDAPNSNDIDPDAAMRDMMGFSSFATRRPKPQPQAQTPMQQERGHPATEGEPPGDSIPVSHPGSSLDLPARHAHTTGDRGDAFTETAPEQLPVRPVPLTSSPTVSEAPSSQRGPSSAARERPDYNPDRGFISAVTNTQYSRAELAEWAKGKPNARGDLVFFKPGFVAEDPWSRIRPKA